MPTDCKYVCCCTAWILLYSEDIFHENSHVGLNFPLSCGAVAFRLYIFFFLEYCCKYVMFWGGSVWPLFFFCIRIPKCIPCCRNACVKMLFSFFFTAWSEMPFLFCSLCLTCKYFTREKWKTVNLFYECALLNSLSQFTIKVQFPDHSRCRVAYLLRQ